MRFCCVKCGKSHDEKSHICKECYENLVMPYTQEWWEKIIKEKDKQNESLQTKLQQAKDGLKFYANKKIYQPKMDVFYGEENYSSPVILDEQGKKARETLEIINKE